MYPRSHSPPLDKADYPPSHNVFFVITHIVSRASRPPDPSSRNTSLAIALAVSGFTHPKSQCILCNYVISRTNAHSPKKPQCIPCNRSHRLGTRPTTDQVTMYSSRLLTLWIHPPRSLTHQVTMYPSQSPNRLSRPLTKSQCILCDYSAVSRPD